MSIRSSRLATLITCLAILLVSCASGSDAKGISGRISSYVGDADYASSVSALVYEQIPEEDGRYGIVYRVVTDREGLLTQDEVPICLYFYSSMASGETTGITAGVEDLAQMMSDKVLFVAVDGVTEKELSAGYGVEAYPEFVLLTPGQPPVMFEGMNYDMWTVDDVAVWMEQNGYAPDRSRLEG